MPRQENKPDTGKEVAVLYKTYRLPFFYFARRYSLSDPDIIADIYQESFMDFYSQYIQKNEYENFTCSAKTLLFGIGRNKILNYHRENNKTTQVDFPEHIPETEIPFEEDEWKAKQEMVYPIVKQMKEPCNRVLSLYYWEEKNMKEIAQILRFKNESVAKTKKYKCMQSLKEKLSVLF